MNLMDKDPVCGMSVTESVIDAVYVDIRYVFCSEQCRERFLANPHIYVGGPGHKAPKQRGMQVLKRRRFSLERPLTPLQGELLVDYLSGMVGMREVHAEGGAVEVTYDLLEVTAEQVEKYLVGIGLGLGEEWSERLRRGFIHFLEETEVSGLEEPTHKHLRP